MNLLWKPIVHSASLVEIPEVTISYDDAGLGRFIAGREPFFKSARRRFSVFKEYAQLARDGRLVLPFENEAKKRRFNELHTALVLQGEGFSCWGGVHLFYPPHGRMPTGKKTVIACTDEVRAMKRSWQWPNEIQDKLRFCPKNPDLVAHSATGNDWRFCEVKGVTEPIHLDQLRGLAVLHLLTGAPIAIIRVVDAARELPSDLRYRPAEILYKKGAEFSWMHSLRRKCL